jgi:hypothetical protein
MPIDAGFIHVRDYMPPECVAQKQEGSPQPKGWIERVLDWIFGTTETSYSYVKLENRDIAAIESYNAGLVFVFKRTIQSQMGKSVVSSELHMDIPNKQGYSTIDHEALPFSLLKTISEGISISQAPKTTRKANAVKQKSPAQKELDAKITRLKTRKKIRDLTPLAATPSSKLKSVKETPFDLGSAF